MFRVRLRHHIDRQGRLNVVALAQHFKHAGLLGRMVQFGQLIQRLKAQIVEKLSCRREKGRAACRLSMAPEVLKKEAAQLREEA